MNTLLLIAILVMIYWVYGQRNYPIQTQEYFAPVEEGTTTDQHEDQFIISPDNIQTYALYQPYNSGRHLNFFSHAPNTVPFYPDQLWTAQISDPYYQPAYKSYFYQEGYFYPLK